MNLRFFLHHILDNVMWRIFKNDCESSATSVMNERIGLCIPLRTFFCIPIFPVQAPVYRLTSFQTQILLLLAMLILTTAFNQIHAEDSFPEVVRVQLALKGDDATEKRTALRALAGSHVGTDEQVIPLLIDAIGDRQGGESAVRALISRTGQTPLSGEWKNNARKTRSAWNIWFEKWKIGQRIKDLEKKLHVRAQVEKNEPDLTVKKQPSGSAVRAPEVSNDLGKLYRIIFKSGGSFKCFIKAQIVNHDGTLNSVRIVHTEGPGEETIDATLITRIDDVSK